MCYAQEAGIELRRRGKRTLDSSSIPIEDDGFQELVVFALLVTSLDGADWIVRGFTLAQDDTL